MQRYRLANLSLAPTCVYIGTNPIGDAEREWVQRADMWTAYYYHHHNVVGVDNATFLVKPDSIVFFAPGVRASHARLGEDLRYNYSTFDLPGTGDRMAIPIVVENFSAHLPQFNRAMAVISNMLAPTRAWIWNLLWSVAENPVVSRSVVELYEAEEWILKNLDRRFTIPQLATAIGVSQRQLLRAFRKEHGASVQEFIRIKRIREATRLLSTTQVPIKQIAQGVGIPDLQAFNKAIREETGASPRAYREIAWESNTRPPEQPHLSTREAPPLTHQ